MTNNVQLAPASVVPAQSRRALLIYNPNAGQAPMSSLDEIVRGWSAAGWTIAAQHTAGPGHATLLARAAAKRGYGLVIALGGDGTVNEVINGLAGSDTILAVLPSGTVNVWVRELRLPIQALAASEALLEGEVHAIDLGLAGGRYFLLMAGIGLDAAVASEVRRREKKRFGALAYGLRALTFLGRYRGTRVTCSLDGRRVKGRVLQVIIGNSRLYAGLIRVTHQAVIDDGLLDVCVIKGNQLYSLPLQALAIVLRRHTLLPEIEYYRARKISLYSIRPLAVQVDGEIHGYTPMSFEILPRGLRVLVPKTAPEELFQNLPGLTSRGIAEPIPGFKALPWPLGPR